ncbi:class III bacteriocin [Lentilactobacillus hilgardii]|nr:class III bacteriocin [Lentilactobacillus hilgardii]MCV3741250.1 class III bacteriocin [Lentilactobacillus hilgardii]
MHNSVLQCFTVFDNSAYVLQIDQSGDSPQLDNVYIARGTVDQSQGTVTFESDYMTLEGFGHCQSLDFYQYNNQVYLWIGLDGKQTDNGHYWGTQLGRIQYTPGQTISSYTDVTRLSNLIAANQNGQDVGTLKRVESTVSEDSSKMVVMDITTDDKVYFTYYDFQQLNALLDQKDNVTPHYLSCETEDSVKALAHDWGSPFQLSDMLSSSQSVQGLAIDSSNNVYISSGSKDTDSYIAKGAWGASYFNQQAVSSPSEDASQWSAGAGIIEIEGLQLYYGNVDATVTKHLHGDSSTEKEDKSYIYSFPETQF